MGMVSFTYCSEVNTAHGDSLTAKKPQPTTKRTTKPKRLKASKPLQHRQNEGEPRRFPLTPSLTQKKLIFVPSPSSSLLRQVSRVPDGDNQYTTSMSQDQKEFMAFCASRGGGELSLERTGSAVNTSLGCRSQAHGAMFWVLLTLC